MTISVVLRYNKYYYTYFFLQFVISCVMEVQEERCFYVCLTCTAYHIKYIKPAFKVY